MDVHVSDLIALVSATRVVTDIGHSLREGFYMLWETLWALVLGFSLSGAIQAFVSRDTMQRNLGDHRPASVGRASLFGMASSSCSYAASATAKALVARGADFLAAMVFLFASTNLVVELGVVLLLLIGWQFLVAEFVGGAVMIVLLVVLGGLWLRGRALSSARAVAEGPLRDEHDTEPTATERSLKEQIRSRAGWADAAAYTVGDLTMLRKELVIGFTAAGFLATLVPTHAWNDLFLHGHGGWTTLENAAVGPLVAIISFVCSIGNVPLAAALWKGGISFGGVVSFVFADLITLPILLIYRKQYGGRMALRMLALFWIVMSGAGLVTEELFRAVGWIPTHRPSVVAADTLRFNYTTILDVLALVLFGFLFWLYKNREHFGGGLAYATDPVCGMQVEVAHAPALTVVEGRTIYFCSEHCLHRFNSNSQSYPNSSPTESAPVHFSSHKPA